MKALLFTDPHGSKKAISDIRKKAKKEKVDVVVCAGDLSIFGAALDLICADLNKIGVPVLVIHGNHELKNEMKAVSAMFENIIFIHKKLYRIGKHVFIGYGGGGFSLRDSEFVKWTKTITQKIKKGDKVVLMFHGPPYGTNLDKIVGGYCGNKDYRDFIKKTTLSLVVCGHIHENFEKKDKIGENKIINPGPYGKVVNL